MAQSNILSLPTAIVIAFLEDFGIIKFCDDLRATGQL